MRKKVVYILISLVAVIITITTASFIFHRPVPKAAELRRDTKRLNLTVTNADSEYPELKGLDKKMQYYMRKWQFKGISLAITRGDSLVYAKGYGWAEEEKGIEMTKYDRGYPFMVSNHSSVKDCFERSFGMARLEEALDEISEDGVAAIGEELNTLKKRAIILCDLRAQSAELGKEIAAIKAQLGIE